MQGEREHDSNKVERTSEEKPSWWSKLPFWREEQSAVDAAEAEARREASSLCRHKLCKPVFCQVHLRTAMPASLSCFAVRPSLFKLVTLCNLGMLCLPETGGQISWVLFKKGPARGREQSRTHHSASGQAQACACNCTPLHNAGEVLLLTFELQAVK